MRIPRFPRVSYQASRRGLRVVLQLSLVVALCPQEAAACGGPCAVPELWSLQPTTTETVVVSNFGLIGHDADGWVLACEEHIGGILLDVKAAGNWLVALTDAGVWLSRDGVCAWQPGPTSARSAWFLDSAVGEALEDAPQLLVLAPDSVEQHTNLERSEGDVFEIVRSFDEAVAFRNLAASANLDHVFVSGYSQGPRTWHLSYSSDAGQTWTDLVPPEVDNSGAAMVPKRVDPDDPSRLFLAAQTPSGGGDQVWLFDATTHETKLLTTLEDSEVLSNIAFTDQQVWVAGRRNGGGSLYRADLAALDFTRVVSDAPSLACLETVGSTLLTCANDYSYESAFLVAEVKDQGATFVPQMQVSDLVGLHGCADSCGATLDWLRTTYAPPTPAPDAGAGEPDTQSETTSETESDAVSEPTVKPDARKSAGCAAAPSGSNPTIPLALALLACCISRVRQRRVG